VQVVARIAAARPLLIAWLCVACLLALGAALAQADPPSETPTETPSAEDQAARVAQLERRVVELLAELREVRSERDRLQQLLDRLVRQEDRLEADRLLLVELRKELPATRVEAEAHLARLQRLGLIADPTRLAPLATRMLEAGTVYLDWRHAEFPSADARNRAFAETGAHGFPTAFGNFRNAVLLSVSNRIEGLLVLIE
jgi:hypothetical protein